MSFELHQTYAAKELASAWCPIRTGWGGQLLLGEDRIALVTQVGPAETAPHFLDPTRFRFRPDRDYHPADAEYGWMPCALAEHSRTGVPVYLFVAAPGEQEYFYLGHVSLGMYTGAADWSRQHVTLTLHEKPPREAWVRLGGYPGWKAAVNHEEFRLEAGDLAGLQARLAATVADEMLHVELTRYEGDSLEVIARGPLAYLMLGDVYGGFEISYNPEFPEDTEEVEPFFCSVARRWTFRSAGS